MKDNIVLIGFMGVGKGRTARELASFTGQFSVDTDDLIESLTKMKIRKIFATHGETHFRQLELRTASWIETNVTNSIVSTGGGFFKVSNINNLGRVIYLHASLESIISRIKSHPNGEKKIKKRPLLGNLETARSLYRERLPLYRAVADHECDVEGKSPEDVVKEILVMLGK